MIPRKMPRTIPPTPKIKKAIKEVDNNPLISIITPVYNTKYNYILDCYNSIQNQKYSKWEWCICDDGSTNKDLLRNLNKFSVDKRVKIKTNDTNKGISFATNAAVSLAKGEFIIFLDHDDELHEEALLEITNTLKNYNVDIIYTDEIFKGKTLTYHYKPNFSPHYLLSTNYICHLVAVRKSLYDSIGGIRNNFDGSQDHDLILRLTHASKKIFHIPKALYYWRIHSDSFSRVETKQKAIENGIKAVQDEIQRRGLSAITTNDPNITHYSSKITIKNNPKVSIVILRNSTNNTIYKNIDNILNITEYNNYEIIIVSYDTNKLERVYKNIANINIIKSKKNISNYTQALNLGVASTTGEYICIIHENILIQTTNWIEWLLGYAQDSLVGVVGGKVYDDSNIIVGSCGSFKKDGTVTVTFNNLNKDADGDFRRAKLIQNTSIVFNTMMFFKKDRYNKVGGFDENFVNLYSDIDFSLKLKGSGYFNVYVPQCEALLLHNDIVEPTQLSSKISEIKKADELIFKNIYKKIAVYGDPYFDPIILDNNKWITNHKLNNTNILLKEETKELHQHKKLIKNDNENNLVSYIIPWYNDIPIAVPSLLVQLPFFLQPSPC